MKWEGNRESDNVEDRRGDGGGGGGGFGFGGRSIGIGTIAIALIGSYFLGVSPMTIINALSGGGSMPVQQEQPAHAPPKDDREAKFVSVVLADTEDVWTQLFRAQNAQYVKPKLVLFTGATQTACGTGQTASGPFYCPGDQKVYIDLAFYRLMQQRFHVSSEFANAYVIAHEVGHHVQHLLGIDQQVAAARERGSERQANAMSVKLELQADCFAGVWGFHANKARSILEQGDVEGALSAATAIGDDTLQKQSQGQVVPDSFTHGTSAQRVRWFTRGIQSGQIEQCDTFGASQL
ncbi:neutral zinc metallopeptidase [Massilia sp. R2A-15]|uniref:KPN_02809 family neutral zinc metallopeptidase n=1 Tax=Massilia sp. R2A-15 TaxID=3064278 RepID=UPI002734C726|nr:neutral zinc metallopeptidase [Massilia sp. R2A-15]WLI87653.1 neutral zinc metallopeptidase [Massilia sp. R2A-15]